MSIIFPHLQPIYLSKNKFGFSYLDLRSLILVILSSSIVKVLFSASPASVGCWAVLKTRNNNALSFMRLFDVVAVESAQELKMSGSPGAVSPWRCPSVDSCEVECL